MLKFTNKKFISFWLIITLSPFFVGKVMAVRVNSNQDINSNTAKVNANSSEPIKSGKTNKNTAPKPARQSSAVSSDKNSSSDKTSTKSSRNSQKMTKKQSSANVSSAKNKHSATKPANATTPNDSKAKNEECQTNQNVQNQSSHEQGKDLQDTFNFIKSNELKGTFFEDDKILLYAGISLIIVSIAGLYITFRHNWRKNTRSFLFFI